MSSLIIQCIATPLHKSVSSILAIKFSAIQHFLTPEFERKINMKFCQDYMRFGDQWEGSQKRHDFAFERVNADGALEIK